MHLEAKFLSINNYINFLVEKIICIFVYVRCEYKRTACIVKHNS